MLYIKKKKILIIVSWVAVFVWMGIIYALSAQVAEESQELSSSVTEIIIETVEKIVPGAEIDRGVFGHYVRKNAHFSVYLLLGILTINGFTLSYSDRSLAVKRKVLLSLLICILYAFSDELHQTFVPGREGQLLDVVIDSFGAIIGISIYLSLKKPLKKLLGNKTMLE